MLALNWAGKKGLSLSDVLFHDYKYWDNIAPIIDKAYDYWSQMAMRPSANVYLAGDYTHYNPLDPLPYGMIPAYLSGQRVGALIGAKLEQAGASIFEQQYLFNTQLFYLHKNQPMYLGQQAEGNVAYYGLILKVNQDEHLQKYLWEAQVKGLWEYQKGFGVTLEDSTLVIDGLLASGISTQVLDFSIRQLVRYFYEESAGVFHTLSPIRKNYPFCAQGRAKYWEGPSVEGTAHAGNILRHFGGAYQKIVGNCQRYVANNQHPLGFWTSRWFPSIMWGTYQAVQLLKESPITYKKALEKAKKYLINNQMENGSWQASVQETCYAILALECFGDSTISYIDSAKQWLVSQKAKDTLG
ncbi:MAG: hypothetical protein AAF960_28360, partial [Bacteroidota bacterium]